VITGTTPFAKDDEIDYDFDSDEEAEMNVYLNLSKGS
jgi:hypothetical protein